ncbi:MAG: hypothetical protein IJ146_03750 [Kiritimatiellae bacterium]|nr:hypothetical protein [Kiritimatiellia bacterium]
MESTKQEEAINELKAALAELEFAYRRLPNGDGRLTSARTARICLNQILKTRFRQISAK